MMYQSRCQCVDPLRIRTAVAVAILYPGDRSATSDLIRVQFPGEKMNVYYSNTGDTKVYYHIYRKGERIPTISVLLMPHTTGEYVERVREPGEYYAVLGCKSKVGQEPNCNAGIRLETGGTGFPRQSETTLQPGEERSVSDSVNIEQGDQLKVAVHNPGNQMLNWSLVRMLYGTSDIIRFGSVGPKNKFTHVFQTLVPGNYVLGLHCPNPNLDCWGFGMIGIPAARYIG